jgi:hypothetical protein
MSRFNTDQNFLPYDEREFDPTRCMRLYSSGIGPGTMSAVVAASATISYVNSYSGGVHNYAVIAPAASTNASRGWISDRRSTANSSLFPGIFEMDSTSRVRILNPNSSTGVVTRVGFSMGHSDPGGDANSISFQCIGNSSTWSVVHSCNYQIGGVEFRETIDTGISVADWHTLRAWVNANADEAVYSIDGKVVHRVKGSQFIPSRFNDAAYVEGAASGNGMQSGVHVRVDSGLGGIPAGYEGHVDWSLTRFFMQR